LKSRTTTSTGETRARTRRGAVDHGGGRAVAAVVLAKGEGGGHGILAVGDPDGDTTVGQFALLARVANSLARAFERGKRLAGGAVVRVVAAGGEMEGDAGSGGQLQPHPRGFGVACGQVLASPAQFGEQLLRLRPFMRLRAGGLQDLFQKRAGLVRATGGQVGVRVDEQRQ
jgi:hypothetical protein